MRLFSLPAIALLLALTANAQKNNIFVAVTGNDKNAGDLKRPFKTIERALSFASQLEGAAVHIRLRGGTYYLDRTIILREEQPGPSALEIAGYKNEKAIISGGRRLQLEWKPWRNGIFQARLPQDVAFERLYVNGKLQVLARYPNYDPGARIFHGTAADAIAPERVKKWKAPAGGYVHALHAGEWGGFHYRITGADSTGILQLEGGWQNNRPASMHQQFRFVENIFEELDTVNEWWVDTRTRTLYYCPPKNIDLSTAVIEVSRLKNSIELHGSAEKPLRNIVLKNLRFEHNERSFMDTKEPLLRSDWTIYRGGAVLLEGTEDCAVMDCSFISLGGNAIMISGYNKHDTISGCLVEHIGANAVCFIGDPSAVRSPLFNYDRSMPYDRIDKTAGALNNNFPQECTASDNLFHDLGEIEKQATGVEIEMSSAIEVSHNSIYNTPRAGINIGDGCWGGHVFAYNDVFNTVLETGDHGAFNSWGRDRYWSPDRHYMDSIVEAHPELILLDAQKQNSIHDNRFRCDHGWDIDLDDGSTNYHIYNNVCLNGGLKLREGFYRIVENNIMINNSFHPHVWFENSRDEFMHNIVLRPYAPIQIRDWGARVDENLFPDTAALHKAQSAGTDAHSKAGSPMFIDPAEGDYSVADHSPALALGFRNFPMRDFGVRKPALKRIALQPEIPALDYIGQTNGKAAAGNFEGSRLKPVEGLGDRSAYGLPDEQGLIIVQVGEHSMLARSGLMDKDVIRTVEGLPVKSIGDLRNLLTPGAGKDKVQLEIMRNQHMIKVWILVK